MGSDFLLIRKLKQGSDEAADLFIRTYYPDILQYCRYHCPDNCDAEDMAQETFVHFFQNLSSYSYMGKTKNYLYTIARNLCLDSFRKRKELPMEELPEPSADPTSHIQSSLLVEWALDKLSKELREIIILYYFQELRQKEIAKVLHIGLPLVKYRIKRAKEELKQILGEEESHEH